MLHNKTELEEFVDLFLDEENDFEALLEYFDITVYEALECLFENGLVDEELLGDFIKMDTSIAEGY